MIRGERGGNALTPPFLAGSPADRRTFGRAGWVLRPLKIFGRPRETTPGRKTADVARQGATSGLRWSGSQPKSAGDSSKGVEGDRESSELLRRFPAGDGLQCPEQRRRCCGM